MSGKSFNAYQQSVSIEYENGDVFILIDLPEQIEGKDKTLRIFILDGIPAIIMDDRQKLDGN